MIYLETRLSFLNLTGILRSLRIGSKEITLKMPHDTIKVSWNNMLNLNFQALDQLWV